MPERGLTKRFLYVNRKAPHGTVYALEALEVMLIGAAFEQDVSLAFIDDGVYQLKSHQDTRGIGMKNFSLAYKALGDYGIHKVYVEKESLEIRGLTANDLLDLKYEDENDDWVEKPSIRVVDKDQLAGIMDEQDVVLSF